MDGLTTDLIKQIHDDAEKAVVRQFKLEAEDNGWKPSQWQPEAAIQELMTEADSKSKKKD